MYTPRLNELNDYMNARWIANGFKKRLEPIDTKAYLLVAIPATFEDCENFTDFDELHLEFALQSLEDSVRHRHNGEFYWVGAYFEGETLVLMSSYGDMPEEAKDKEERVQYIPDTEALQKIKNDIEARWIRNGFVKLDEPVEDACGIYCAVKLDADDCYTATDFDFIYLEPTILCIEKEMPLSEQGEFYCVDVQCRSDNVFVVTSTRGTQPEKLEVPV